MNIKIVKDLIELIKDTDVVELEWTPERIHIIRRSGPNDVSSSRLHENDRARVSMKEKHTVTVTSPLVGTFYRSPSPETPPYVKVGDKVSKNQVLCVIEAMKLMNEIESHVDGIVAAILKQDGERVGYGDQLFIIEEL
ncbi:MAG TPA: acetyl-CoA carboxylase biotin carboxyl carrier protein [Deltaproteobacteria bacterium]|nr:acetyl-CoA carboxylase biotin carboxyl carrier protein [Deltaproteobacteria bacterium]HPR53583.1 acetyl-CoA carboxylase biotin carboxyl carrier protein [Deltaproteobacteria bacterium]HXK47098.1 acetyl-CoA carboxylase biotin carboxyl carrier protein [Deltaproteobacteria bacterium]